MTEDVMPVATTDISADEIDEINRLARNSTEKYKVFMTTYQVVKEGKKGKKAIDEINGLLPPEMQINQTEFNKIVRVFREQSKLLKAEKKEAMVKANTEAIKIQDKMDLIMEKGITAEKVKKASLKDTVIAYGTLFDKKRLAEDKSTENVAIAGRLKDATNEKILVEMKGLRGDMKQMEDFAKKHDINLPSDEYVEMRMKKKGDIPVAEVVPRNEDEDDDQLNDTSTVS